MEPLYKGCELEWEDGTPVTGIVNWVGEGKRALIYVSSVNGAEDGVPRKKGRPSGYYNVQDGGYNGSESKFQKLRVAKPKGPEVYEEWFR